MSFAGQAACKARLFFPPFLLATQKKWGRLSGLDPTPSLKASTPLQQGAGWPPSPPSPSGGRRRMPPHPHPLPQAGEGVQGAALVLPRTPAARLACFDIKIQISGGCLNGATQERSEFRRTSRLQGSPFLSPISFGDAKEMGSAVGPRPDPLPESKHTASTRSRLAPIPAFPQWGKEIYAPSPPPSPASGRGSSRRSACATPHASCKTGVLRHKNSNFRRLSERSDAGAQ